MIELAGIIILGILAQWVAWKFTIPAILPLILIGLLVGPFSTLYTEDCSKLIEPIWNGKHGLFPGESLFYFVSLAIGIILFEGGLTLRRSEILNVAPVILKLITLGAVVTFFGAGIAAHYTFGLSWPISFLFSSLIIVTGPTVITPILRNIPLKKDLSTVLKWEGILIDPIGALVSVLVFEFISLGDDQEFTSTALGDFGKVILFGFTFGFTFAHALAFAIKKKVIPHYLLNVVTLASVLTVFVLSDIFAHESGLLSVVIMGMVLGNINLPNIDELLYFKESLSVLLISILFILLAANINLEDLRLVLNWNMIVLFVSVVFIVRPLSVFLSSMSSGLKFNEKLFISWVGPRGIVAAGIASLFGLKLTRQGEPGAEYITSLVFMIVLGTVLLNATTARIFAKIVGVFLKKSEGIFIVGASKIARLIAAYLKDNNRRVVVIDSNKGNIKKSKNLGLEAFEGNIYSDKIINNVELNDIGYLLALTGSGDINKYVINKFKNQLGEHGSYRLMTSEELNNSELMSNDELFSKTSDYYELLELAEKYPSILEIRIESKEQFMSLLKMINDNKNRIPLFIKDPENNIHILASYGNTYNNIEKDSYLAYIGKPIDVETIEDL